MESAMPVQLFSGVASPAARTSAEVIMSSGQIAGGPKVAEFERAFGAVAEQAHVVATSDVTSAMVLALKLSGVAPNDEVLAVTYSCLSSNAAIAQVGATPRWVDVDPRTASISLSDLNRAVTPRTRALSLYHIAGYPAKIQEIADFCRERQIVLIEDCNNALGATVDGRSVGQWGDFAVYSFYPNRQINALEGGALACRQSAMAARARRLRRFGIDMATFRDEFGEIDPASDVPEIGWSASLSHVSAAVGLAHLATWPERLDRIRAVARRYRSALTDIPGIQPVEMVPGAQGVYWGFLVLCDQRDRILHALKGAGVQASMLHQRNDTYSGYRAVARSLPGTDEFVRRVLALPCGWWLRDEQVEYVLDELRSAARRFC